MNDRETLAWAKERAIEYLDARHVAGAASAGSLAITSMISDLGKHPALVELRYTAVMTSPFDKSEDEIRAWIRELVL